MSNFDDVKEVRITLKIASKALYFMAYSTYQEWLFEKVCYLRDVEKMTFDAIAKESLPRDSSQLEASNLLLKVRSLRTKKETSENKDLPQNQATL